MLSGRHPLSCAGGESGLAVAGRRLVGEMERYRGLVLLVVDGAEYAKRSRVKAIETAFETMSAWGLGRFMVRTWKAVDHLLWIVALAYMLIRLVLQSPSLTRFPPATPDHPQAFRPLRALAHPRQASRGCRP